MDGVNWSVPQSFSASRTWTLADGEGFRTAYVRFQDTAGNWSTGQISDGIVVDKTPPTVPTGVTATSTTPGSVSVAWNASTDAVGVSQYSVYRDGQLLGSVSARSYTDSAAAAGKTYAYTVKASDAAATFQPQVLPPQSRLRGRYHSSDDRGLPIP